MHISCFLCGIRLSQFLFITASCFYVLCKTQHLTGSQGSQTENRGKSIFICLCASQDDAQQRLTLTQVKSREVFEMPCVLSDLNHSVKLFAGLQT